MKTLKWILISLAGLIILIAIFYAEEDWRGKRAWENCKRELEAKGEVLNWDKFIPPPVPDDQNFFAAPKMQDWFVRHNVMTTATELHAMTTNADNVAVITDKAAAAKYLAWSGQFQPDFDLMREALKRPYARMDGDYSKPYEIPIVNFVNVRAVAQVLEQRAKCDLLLGQPEKALNELTLLNDSRRMMERTPTGEPMTLVDAMVNVAVTGLYVDTIADGFQKQAWQEPQLVTLQKQLAEINLTPFVLQAFQEEPASVCHTAEIVPFYKIVHFIRTPKLMDKISSWFWPSGWTYQNMVYLAVLEPRPLDGFDLAHDTIAPRKFDEASHEFDKFFRHKSPYKLLAAIAAPNFTKATQVLAYNQTKINEAQIACALERYRLAHGDYPETLDVLAPQFIETIPHDIIGGPPSQGSGATSQPLHYRRTNDGKFLLYSVGWNETDDGGKVVLRKGGSVDQLNGDWVWQYPQK